MTAPAAGDNIEGNKQEFVLPDQYMRIIASRLSRSYAAGEAQTGIYTGDVSSLAGFTHLFQKVPRANQVVVRANQDMKLRFNNSTGDQVSVDKNVPFDWSHTETKQLFIETTLDTNLRIIMA